MPSRSAFPQHMPQHMFCSILVGTNAFWFCHLGSWLGRSFINKFATLLGANLLKLKGLNNTKRLEVFFWKHDDDLIHEHQHHVISTFNFSHWNT